MGAKACKIAENLNNYCTTCIHNTLKKLCTCYVMVM